MVLETSEERTDLKVQVGKHNQGKGQAEHAQQRRQSDQGGHIGAVVAHARCQHIASGGGGECRENEQHIGLHGVQLKIMGHAPSHAGQQTVLDAQDPGRNQFALPQGIQLQACTRRHQP
jgi:hypothetical protein